ncbi:MAG: hypothetical protein KatS3mg077_1564 [Candidatus Binatia bacterium]|nr:MAG: hypothetical protein KatS3mg077_1564 [Candidatus Binatia bacterium]
MVGVIVAAAGQGIRLGGEQPKALRDLGGRPLYWYTLATLAAVREVRFVWLVVPPAAEKNVVETLAAAPGFPFSVEVVGGGKERQDSVSRAMEVVPAEATIVAVHDAARPFASPRLFESCLAAARIHGAAIAAVPAADTVKLVVAGVVRQTLDRTTTWLAQTPQVARADWLRAAMRQAHEAGLRFTDEAGALEHCGYPVHVVRGEETNRKLTTPEDWEWAEWLLERTRRSFHRDS